MLEKHPQLLCMIPYTLHGVILALSVLNVYSSMAGILVNTIAGNNLEKCRCTCTKS